MPLSGQDVGFRVGAGVAIPVGGAGERRDMGPAGTISIESSLTRVWSVRVDGDWSLLRGTAAPPGQEHLSNYQDLRSLGITANGIARFSDERLTPYLLIGLGAYRLQRVDAPKSPYGVTPAAQVGVGLGATVWDLVNPFVEVRALIHATDYGSREFTPTVYWPVLVGVRIR